MGHPDPELGSQYAAQVTLCCNASVISTGSSSSSLIAPLMSPQPSLGLTTPTESRDRPPAWLARRFNQESGDGSGQQTPRILRSPVPSPTTRPRMTSPDDFEFGEEIGSGSWSIVVEAVYPPAGKHYAIKILNKAQLVKEKMSQSAVVEKNALALLSAGDHPGIVRLYSAFHDATSLYLVLSLATNGDLRDLVKSVGSFSVSCARYYTAQIVDAVQWMHSKGVLHRDLKPENVLIDQDMRIKLADFGSAYISKDLDLSPRTSTFVGTAAYVSPELLYGERKTTSLSSDIWAIGCIIYFLFVGQSPFLALTDYLSFKKIEALDYTFPEGFDEDARDLILRIIVTDPSERIGVPPKSSPDEIRDHPFFIRDKSSESYSKTHPRDYIDWESLWVDPPVPIESGLVQVHLRNEQEAKLAEGIPWDTFIQEFSVINAENDDSGSESELLEEKEQPDVPRSGYQKTDGTLQPLNMTDVTRLEPSMAKSLNGGELVSPTDTVRGKLIDFSDDRRIKFGNSKVTRIPNEDGESDIPDRIVDIEPVDVTKNLPWSFTLLPSETVKLVTIVQVRTGHRLFQQTKQRTLALTSMARILCVKPKNSGAVLVVKQELVLPIDHGGNRPGSRIISAVLQGGHSLVLTTHDKTLIYKIHDPAEAQMWISEIDRLMSQSPD